MPTRTQDGIRAAISRLNDEYLIPLHELAGKPVMFGTVEVRPSAVVLARWGRSGKSGVHLDVLFCRRKQCWVTSREALARFAAELAAGKQE